MPARRLPQVPGYDITSRLGRGAQAVISLGVERATRQRVAIKHVIRNGPEDDKFIAQAENEYQVAKDFDHPYLRRCLDIIRVRRWLRTQELYLIMEYVDGERLEDHRPEKLERVVSIFTRTAEGLHAMHKYGYAHADIKPNNILLTRDGGLKIIDYGQSCPLGHRKERIQGTPDYMAPEQVLRQPIDQRTDVFNLGASMYWVVTGKAYKTIMPSVPAGARKISLEHKRGVAPPHELNAKIPTPLSLLIMDCCANEKSGRPRDMREVISRLDTVLHLHERRKNARPSGGSRGHHAEG